ncbi:MAG: hypothetical protein M5U28_45340 [Sandaracinaceae bacterium]|nr:hypothetical protein [Sandaracinaceae bacterium]
MERARPSWPAVRVAVRGLGVFGSPERPPRAVGRPRSGGRGAAHRRRARVLRAGRRPAPEERSFTAHVTLARLTRPDRRALRALLERQARFETEAFDVPALVLYQSTLTNTGAVHQARRSFALGA